MCWPLSRSSPNSGWTTRRARPPGVRPASNTVTLASASRSATLAARPAQPAPMTATFIAPAGAPGGAAAYPGLPGQPQLAHGRQRNALVQHLPVVALDFVEQRMVDGRHHQPGPLGAPVRLGQGLHRLAVQPAGALGLKAHQRAEAFGMDAVEDIGGLDLELLQFIDRQVDAAAPRVVADVADDVGELERQSQLAGIVQRARILVAEHAGRQFADHAGHVPTVLAQAGPVQVAGLVQVHLHAVDDGQQTLARDVAIGQVRLQRARDGVVRLAIDHLVDLRAPPGQLDARQGRVAAFVDHVVDLATERVQRSNGPPPRRRQEQERVIEAGAAFGGLFLAVFVRGHIR